MSIAKQLYKLGERRLLCCEQGAFPPCASNLRWCTCQLFERPMLQGPPTSTLPVCDLPEGVDVIEAGFPVASPDDFEGVRCIAQEARPQQPRSSQPRAPRPPARPRRAQAAACGFLRQHAQRKHVGAAWHGWALLRALTPPPGRSWTSIRPPCLGPHPRLKQVGNTVRDDGYVPAICAFARPCDGDIQRAWEAVSTCHYPACCLLISCAGAAAAAHQTASWSVIEVPEPAAQQRRPVH